METADRVVCTVGLSVFPDLELSGKAASNPADRITALARLIASAPGHRVSLLSMGVGDDTHHGLNASIDEKRVDSARHVC